MGLRKCRKCGCTDFNACVHKQTRISCHWIGTDLCSACQSQATRRLYLPPIVVSPPKNTIGPSIPRKRIWRKDTKP